MSHDNCIPDEEIESSKWTMIPNHLIMTGDLSDSAFRLLAYLLSNTKAFTIYMSVTAERLKWGAQKLQKVMKELITKGYVKRSKQINNGRFKSFNYYYSDKPKYLEKTNATPVQASQPRSDFPSTEIPSTENHPLTIPTIPTIPTLNKTKGNALTPRQKGTNPRAVGTNPRSKGTNPRAMDQAPPFSTAKRGAMEKSASRKYPRKPEQQAAFDWLMGLNLCDADGIVSEDQMSFLAHQHSMKRLKDCYAHMRAKIARGEPIRKSRIALFKFLLAQEHNPIGSNVDINRTEAVEFAKAVNWSSLVVCARYASDKRLPGKELPLNLEPQVFSDALAEMYTSLSAH